MVNKLSISKPWNKNQPKREAELEDALYWLCDSIIYYPYVIDSNLDNAINVLNREEK